MAQSRYLNYTKTLKKHLPSVQIGLKVILFTLGILPNLFALITEPVCKNDLPLEDNVLCNQYIKNSDNLRYHLLLEMTMIRWGINKALIYSIALNDFFIRTCIKLPKKNPQQMLPKSLTQEVVLFLDADTLAQVACLSKEWKKVIYDSFSLLVKSRNIPLTLNVSDKTSFENFHKKYLYPSRAQRWEQELRKINVENLIICSSTVSAPRLMFVDNSRPSYWETFNFYYNPAYAEQLKIARANNLFQQQKQREHSLTNYAIRNLGFFAGELVSYVETSGKYVLKNMGLRR